MVISGITMLDNPPVSALKEAIPKGKDCLPSPGSFHFCRDYLHVHLYIYLFIYIYIYIYIDTCCLCVCIYTYVNITYKQCILYMYIQCTYEIYTC